MTLPSQSVPAHVRAIQRSVTTEKGCWEFQGYKNHEGYGTVSTGSQTDGTHRQGKAHRVVYEAYVGPIPEGMQLDHLCRNRACVNPAHLEPVTPAENTRRGEGLAARLARRTHCLNGHEFTPENTLRASYRPGTRQCRQCARLRTAARNRTTRVANAVC